MATKTTDQKTAYKNSNAANDKSGAASGMYDPAVRRAIEHVRENNALHLIKESYETDKQVDPVGYDPVLLLCNEEILKPETFQQFRTRDTHDVFVKSSAFGGYQSFLKHPRYNNSHDSSKLRKKYLRNQ